MERKHESWTVRLSLMPQFTFEVFNLMNMQGRALFGRNGWHSFTVVKFALIFANIQKWLWGMKPYFWCQTDFGWNPSSGSYLQSILTFLSSGFLICSPCQCLWDLEIKIWEICKWTIRVSSTQRELNNLLAVIIAIIISINTM